MIESRNQKEVRPIYDGFMLDPTEFLCSSKVTCMTPTQVGMPMRDLGEACRVGDVDALRKWPFVGRLLRKPRPRSRISRAVRQRVFARDGNRCRHCGGIWFLEVDHIKPVVFGGSDDETNLQTLCRGCNKAKGPTAHALRRIEGNA